MKTKGLIFIFAVSAMLLSVTAGASMIIPANGNAQENSKAPENSPVIGENWELESVEFIHYAKPANLGKPAKTENCYKLLGVKWNTFPVNYIINPVNPDGLSNSFVTKAISASAETWDSATSKDLFNDTYIVDPAVQYGVQDYQNAVVFGDYPNDGVIAVTTVWYTRVGKRIVEFDMLFNTRFSWGDATIDPSIMDLQNIATHELGHGVGLADLYNTCTLETMYGYSTEGETIKRDLNTGDIAGLQKIYGA